MIRLRRIFRTVGVTLVVVFFFAWFRGRQVAETVSYKSSRAEFRVGSSNGAFLFVHKATVPPAQLPRVGFGYSSQPPEDLYVRATANYSPPKWDFGTRQC